MAVTSGTAQSHLTAGAIDRDCTTRCHSKLQALQLIAAVIKGNAAEIRSYCRYVCSNFALLADQYGRTLLHIASSCGKSEIVEWFLENCQSEIDIKDKESGWTALHRALFYGQLTTARVLINHNANLKIIDHDGLIPFEIVMKDKLPNIEYRVSDPSEVYIWGSNSNFNLGLGNDLSRENPEILEALRRENVSISKVILCKFHSVFMSNDGRVFTCGHGHGGRLGQNSETTVLSPNLVKGLGTSRVKDVAAGQHHLIILTEEGQIWTCGLNAYHQLGHLPAPERLLIPRPISMKFLKGFQIVGCAAAKFHSVIFTKEAIFTFGLNAGQLGHQKGERTQVQPRQVSSLNCKDTQITHVVASDGATVCATNKGDVYVLHEYQCRKIASRQLELKKICVIGGHLDNRCDVAGLRESGGLELRVILLTNSGRLFLWREENPTLRRCLFAQANQIVLCDIALNIYSLGLISQYGTAYTGRFIQNKEKAYIGEEKSSIKVTTTPVGSLVPLLNRDECEMVKLKRVPLVHRGTRIECDSKGRNFAVIQAHPKSCLYELPLLSSTVMENDFQIFYEEASLDDVTHDALIKVGSTSYYVHKFILASRSEFFRKHFSKHSNTASSDLAEISLENITINVFQYILMYIYTNKCELLKKGYKLPNYETDIPNEQDLNNTISKKKKKKTTLSNIPNPNQIMLESLMEYSKKFGLKTLTEKLQYLIIVDNTIHFKQDVSLPNCVFDRKKFPEYYDVCLLSEDGVEIPCHRCILVARMSYFKGMLASGWIETAMNKPIVIPLPAKILSIMIDYAYKDSAPKLFESEDAEFLCQVLVAANQYLIPRLKEICEVAVVDLITLKNVCELLELSYIYNAAQLKATCLQYICFNLTALLDMECLNVLSIEVMDDLTKTYQSVVPGMDKRLLTPYSCDPTFEQLQKIALEFSVGADENMQAVEIESKPKNRRRTQSRRLSERQNQDKEVEVEKPKAEEMEKVIESECKIKTATPVQMPSVRAKQQTPFDGKWNVSTPIKSEPLDLNSIMKQEKAALETMSQKTSKLGKISFAQKTTLTNSVLMTPPSTPKSAWRVTPSPTNLSQWIINEQTAKTKVPVNVSPIKENPWGQQMLTVNGSPTSPVNLKCTPLMNDIFYEEQQTIQHMKPKSLDLIRMEEEAIQTLLEFYQAENNPSELITVSRIQTIKSSTPSWRKH